MLPFSFIYFFNKLTNILIIYTTSSSNEFYDYEKNNIRKIATVLIDLKTT